LRSGFEVLSADGLFGQTLAAINDEVKDGTGAMVAWRRRPARAGRTPA